MKKYTWQGTAFLLFILALSLGLSYLAFNENSVETANNEQVMSIALVNEDEGATFNDEKIVFGDEFSNSINRDSQHEWYVVSRGVAESGYDRGSYDMVIVIPNDFSEKSLSIHLERPEPVALQYKINATGHENVRAEAEKTAGNVLNEFNTRLIDVYFASVIGNLQEAQDNISEIIAKEKEYTGDYHDNIYTPLADYTNQFQTVQDYTDISKDSYQALEDVLDNFQTQLGEEVDNNQAFGSEVESVVQVKEEASNITQAFSDFLDQFTNRMSASDVMTSLAVLERENELVQQQFRLPEDDERTIASRANFIENRFEQLVNDIEQFEINLKEKLHSELENVVKNNLEFDFDDSIGPAVDGVFNSLNTNILDEIKAQINDLPSINPKDLKDAGLADETLRDILNVITVTEQFIKECNDSEECDLDENIGDESKLLSEKIKEIKLDLHQDGIVVKDTIELPEYDGEEQFLSLSIPETFSLVKLKINEKPAKFQKGKGYKLETPAAGTLSIKAKLKLKEPDTEIDVFSPIEWTWAVSQEGMETEEIVGTIPDIGSPDPEENHGDDHHDNDEHADQDEPEENNGDHTEENGENEAEPENEENNRTDDHGEEEEQALDHNEALGELSSTSSEEDAIDEEEHEEENDQGDNNEGEIGGGTPSPEPENPEEEVPPVESETIIQTNNYFVQKVLTSLVSNPKDELVEAATVMVNDYYQLSSLYELYFGFDMSDELPESISESLRESATESSLYTFIHEREIKDILEEHILQDVTESVTEDIQESMEILEENIATYIELVKGTSNVSTSLVESINQTRDHAHELNEQLTTTLEELAQWRDTSQELTEDKSVVLDHDQEVGSAVMNLNTDFQPLLLASESLAEQARSNFDVANSVYDTFDAIDEQAVNIQESGTNIVAHATDLANRWTEKALEDEVFAENFNEVLANSRVGDRPNENLYRFLANPVQTKNTGIITEGESFTGYFIVIIMAVVTLFTAYVMSTLKLRRTEADVFEAEQSLVSKNQPITLITGITGIVEGLAIGLVSFYLLGLPFEQMYTWLATILLFTVVMLFIATYLLRQLKMVGMFILLTLLSLYLLLTRSLGFRFENSGLVESLRTISPLQQIEATLANMIESGVTPSLLTFIMLIILAAVGLVLNLFVVQKSQLEEENIDENQAEAN